MSTNSESGWRKSIWEQVETEAGNPKYCPSCGEQIAHPDNLKDNDDITAVGRRSAYRKHRQTHYRWGDDPTQGFDGDPYLSDYYDGVTVKDSSKVLDGDEEVAGVYDVEISYESVLKARVVAADSHQAKERAKDLRLRRESCVGGWVPEPEITHELHTDTREVKTLTRGEIDDSEDIDEEEDSGINWAERLPGWPW